MTIIKAPKFVVLMLTILLLLSLPTKPWQAIAQTFYPPCYSIADLSDQPSAPKTFVVVTNNGGFGKLNQSVFNQWGRGSEIVTQILHQNFFGSLSQILRTHHMEAPTPKPNRYTKIQTFTVTLQDGLGADALAEFVYQAQRQAIKQAVALLAVNSTPKSTQIKQFNPLILGPATLPTEAELKAVRMMLNKVFNTEHSLEQFFTKFYAPGIANTEIDAHFSARMYFSRDNTEYRPIVFQLDDLILSLEAAVDIRAQLSWLFENKSDQELIEIFGAIRAALKLSDHKQWNAKFKQFFEQKYRRPFEQLSKEEIERLEFAIRAYIDQLNTLDYLPDQSLIRDGIQGAQEFQLIQNPTGLLIMDGKKVGALNFFQAHKKAPEILHLAQKIKASLQQRSRQDFEGESIQSSIEEAAQMLMKARENIFSDTSEYLDGLNDAIIDALKDLGIDRYALLRNGDDFTLLVSQPKVPVDQIAIKIRLDHRVQNNMRILASPITGRNHLPLSEARHLAGQALDILKIMEKVHLPESSFCLFTPATESQAAQARIVIFSHEQFTLSEETRSVIEILVDPAIEVTYEFR